MRGTRPLVLIVGLLLAPAAGAGEGKKHPWWEVFCPPRLPLPLCCPDDYCPKPPPPLPPEYCPCGCDDYCPKALPPLPGCALPGAKCYPTDGCCPRPKCWWLRWPWCRKGLCRD